MPKALCCETIKGRRRLACWTSIITITLLILWSFLFLVWIMLLWIYPIITGIPTPKFVPALLAGSVLVYACVLCLTEIFQWFKNTYLNKLFPVSCGHTKCIFTGKSSRTLRDILVSIDKELQPEEEFQKAEKKAFQFLNDFKVELEKIANTRFKYFLVGSVAERIGIPQSFMNSKISSFISVLRTDVDVMFYPESINASFSGSESFRVMPWFEHGRGFLGHATLVSRTNGSIISSENIRKQAEQAIDSSKVRNLPGSSYCFGFCQFAANDVKHNRKGPAIKIVLHKRYEADITMSIACSQWPPMSDWPERNRCWPSQEDVKRIVSLGCHLVPGPARSDLKQTGWRFSFSLAEVELSKLIPTTARKCFLALKIILKDHLQPVASNITSYHMKIIFLNTLEKTPSELWVDENIEKCFLMLLKNFHDAILFEHCPHYWFNTINMFGKIPNPKSCLSVVKKLKLIMENPAPFIFDDGCCCISPCCVRRHLYDFPDENLDGFYEKMKGTKSAKMEPRNLEEPVVVTIHSNDEPKQILNQPSFDNEIASQIQEETVVLIHCNGDASERQPILNQPSPYSINASLTSDESEIVTTYSNEIAGGECQPILKQLSCTSNYGALS